MARRPRRQGQYIYKGYEITVKGYSSASGECWATVFMKKSGEDGRSKEYPFYRTCDSIEEAMESASNFAERTVDELTKTV